jgi:ribonuclease HI
MNEYSIYCDGSCSPNPGEGSYAGFILKNDQPIHVYYEYVKDTTNNRMEIKAALEGIKICSSIYNISSMNIFSDSQYVICTITKNWKTKKNVDLWKELKPLSYNLNLNWNWIKGHNENLWNERSDLVANLVRTKKLEFSSLTMQQFKETFR